MRARIARATARPAASISVAPLTPLAAASASARAISEGVSNSARPRRRPVSDRSMHVEEQVAAGRASHDGASTGMVGVASRRPF